MKPTKELFDLIKSLTGSEKRYFKLNASLQKGNKNYIKLFDAIDSQKYFDETGIKNKFKNEKFVRNFTVTKNYLYKLIFKSLINYDIEKSIDARINNIIIRCKILYEKSLFKQYFKTIQTGKKLAYKYERFSSLLELIEIEKHLIKKDEIGKKDFNEIYDEESQILERIRNLNIYKRVVANLFRLSRVHGVVRDKAILLQIEKIVSPKDLEYEALSVRAKESFYLAGFLENRLKGNYEEACAYCKKRFDLISENPGIFKGTLLDPKLDSLEFYIFSAIRMNDFVLAGNIFNQYKKISDSLETDDINLIITDYDIKLSSIIKTKDVKAGETLITEIENFLFNNDGKILINNENYFHFNISKFYIVTGDFKNALKSLNSFFSSKYSKSTPEFESYMRILNIITHYELGNFKLLKYLIPSSKKFLMNKNKLYRFESLILRSVLYLIRIKDKDKIKAAFKVFYKEAQKLKKDRYEKNAFEYFDLINWLESKISVN